MARLTNFPEMVIAAVPMAAMPVIADAWTTAIRFGAVPKPSMVSAATPASTAIGRKGPSLLSHTRPMPCSATTGRFDAATSFTFDATMRNPCCHRVAGQRRGRRLVDQPVVAEDQNALSEAQHLVQIGAGKEDRHPLVGQSAQ